MARRTSPSGSGPPLLALAAADVAAPRAPLMDATPEADAGGGRGADATSADSQAIFGLMEALRPPVAKTTKLARFVELGLKLDDFAEDDGADKGLGELTAAADKAGKKAGVKPSFAGSDQYHDDTVKLHLQVPVVHSRDEIWSESYHRYQSLEKAGETIHVWQQTRRKLYYRHLLRAGHT